MAETDGNAFSRREMMAIAAVVPGTTAAGISKGATASGPAASYGTCNSEQFLDVRRFGARGDGTTDDLPAVLSALAELRRTSPEPAHGDDYFVPGGTLYFPPGRYLLSRTLSLKQQVRLLGESRGIGPGSATVLIFPPNVTGILINRQNTAAMDGSTATTTSAEGSVVEGITVRATGTPDRGSPATGIYARARCTLIACEASGFARDGIALVANETGDHVGNCNMSALRDCSVQHNGRHGLFIAGNNANACVIDNLNASFNGGYGFYDDTDIGQTWLGGHSATNGKLDSGPFRTTSLVWHAGGIYAVLPGEGHAQRAARTPPDKDPALWSLRERTPTAFYNIPAWRPDMALVEGGAGYIRGGRHVHVNPYTEGRQGPYVNNGAIALGGSSGAGFVGRGVNVYAEDGKLQGQGGANLCAAVKQAWLQLRGLFVA